MEVAPQDSLALRARKRMKKKYRHEVLPLRPNTNNLFPSNCPAKLALKQKGKTHW